MEISKGQIKELAESIHTACWQKMWNEPGWLKWWMGEMTTDDHRQINQIQTETIEAILLKELCPWPDDPDYD